jgi:uncharacterized protein YdhG (YjbR/CyaY superfamily)
MTESKRVSVDDYIKDFPPDIQEVLRLVRKTIAELLPEAEQSISYGIPTFKMNGKYVIYFSGTKNHVVIYPIFSGNKDLDKKLEPYKHGKGTVRFPYNQPLPYALLKELVQHNLKFNQERTAKK